LGIEANAFIYCEKNRVVTPIDPLTISVNKNRQDIEVLKIPIKIQAGWIGLSLPIHAGLVYSCLKKLFEIIHFHLTVSSLQSAGANRKGL
jgi:hypothetical protein